MHSQTQKALSDIELHAMKVGKQLEKNKEAQDKLLEQQKQAHDNMRTLQLNQQRSFEDAKRHMRSLLDLAGEQTVKIKEHHETFTKSFSILFETVKQIKNACHVLLDEFMGNYLFYNIRINRIGFWDLLYFTSCIIFGYLLTATSRTASARIPTYIWVVINYFFEKLIIKKLFASTHHEILHSRVWLCRKLFIVIYFVYLIRTFLMYKDYEKINNKLLQRVLDAHEELKREFSMLRENSGSTNLEDTSDNIKEECDSTTEFPSVSNEETCPSTSRIKLSWIRRRLLNAMKTKNYKKVRKPRKLKKL